MKKENQRAYFISFIGIHVVDEQMQDFLMVHIQETIIIMGECCGVNHLIELYVLNPLKAINNHS